MDSINQSVDRNELFAGLETVLADTFGLYLQTHQYHWNVTGPRFHSLHLMFEEQYNELWLAMDVLAERLRALGQFAPGGAVELAERCNIDQAPEVRGDEEMIQYLLQGHKHLVQTLPTVRHLAEEAEDQVSVDLLTQRQEIHEKTAWMLRSMLNQ